MKLVKGLSLTAWLGMFLAHAQISQFQHIVVIVQENRTPDNLFQGLCAPPYGSATLCSINPTTSQYNIETSNWVDKTSPKGVTQPGTVPLANTYDLSHAHKAFVAMCDSGVTGAGPCNMDGAAGIKCSGTCPAKPQFRYVDNSAGIVRVLVTGGIPQEKSASPKTSYRRRVSTLGYNSPLKGQFACTRSSQAAVGEAQPDREPAPYG